MKKALLTILLVLSIALCLVFTACDNSTTKDSTKESTQKSTTDSTPDSGSTAHIHQYGEWLTTLEPTCTETGTKEKKCSCGDTVTESINAKGHNFVNDACTGCNKKAGEGLGFKLNSDGTYYTVTGIGDCNDTYVVIPGTYDGLPITSIGDHAFAGCKTLASIVIPNSVTNIGVGTFEGCTSLASIVIPNGVTNIGDYAFYGCTSLTIYCEAEARLDGWKNGWNRSIPIVWDCNNNDVADDGYIYNVINGVKYGIKDSVATIVEQPRNITNAIIPASITYKGKSYRVTSIGNDAFRGCTSLTSIEIPNSVTRIRSSAFRGCTSLTSIEIPNSVTTIGGGAFSGCTSLTSIEIPNSVTSIDGSAFSGCTSLTSIEIPNSVTSIGENAFRDCTSITIYCEAESKPSGWNSKWNYSSCPVVWGYTENE